MANRFFTPNQEFVDSTGLPYANGTLAFYASGTSTPLATYSDSALTIANTNPVVLDSAGRAGNVFLQNLAYKLVLSDVNNNPIWTADPVYSSDYSTRAKLLSGAGSPNGNTAGTAGSTGIGADTYWDTTNNILYVCTQTGTTSTAVWTAVNSSSATAIVPAPTGYLTPTSGTPVITGDVSGATSVFYTPFQPGNTVPIYNGTSFVPTTFSELTLTLTSAQAASTLYDVFVFNNAGALTLATGPAWTTSTAGSGARGTGAGTTQLSRLTGLWVNTVQITGKNGANTYTISANQGTYLGSLFMDGSAGQVSCFRTYGQSRKWGIWNVYNRVPIFMKVGDNTASWVSNNASSVHAANTNSANSLTVFAGLPEEIVDLKYSSRASATLNSNGAMVVTAGIGFNSTSVYSGKIANYSHTVQTITNADSGDASLNAANFLSVPWIGINVITALENTNGSNVNITISGTETNMLLTAAYRG